MITKAQGMTVTIHVRKPRTEAVRSISAAMYRVLEVKSIDNVLTACEQLLREREWALGVIAYDWAYRVRKQDYIRCANEEVEVCI